MQYLTPGAEDLRTAVQLLQDGLQVALPTETVYGLAADAANPDAVRGIFSAKGRPADHPLIVHLANAEQMRDWAINIPDVAWELAKAFWPGPLTLVLPVADHVSPLVTGGQNTIALRVPAHPVMLTVLQLLNSGLAAPSANPFGQISPTSAAHVQQHLHGRIAAVVDGGACTVGIESTIVDLSREQPAILRPGAVTAEMLAPYLALAAASAPKAAPRVPGSLDSHYAPRTPCYRISADAPAPQLEGKIGLLAIHAPDWPVAQFWPMPADADDYAQALYAALHDADASGCDALLVIMPPEDDNWLAVHDRLKRATQVL